MGAVAPRSFSTLYILFPTWGSDNKDKGHNRLPEAKFLGLVNCTFSFSSIDLIRRLSQDFNGLGIRGSDFGLGLELGLVNNVNAKH